MTGDVLGGCVGASLSTTTRGDGMREIRTGEGELEITTQRTGVLLRFGTDFVDSLGIVYLTRNERDDST